VTEPDHPLQPAVLGLGASPTVALNERSLALRNAGKQVYRLGLGQSPFPVPEPVVRALQAHADRKDYLAVRGLLPLREAVAAYHRRRHGLSVSADDILIAPGSKELMFLLQVVFAGEVLIPTPAWVSYAPQARILGRRVRLLSTSPEDHWKITPAALDAVCREQVAPRVLILNYPSNPTGASFTSDQLGELAEVARRHRVVVLSDEIYGELAFADDHTSIGVHYPEGTIVSSGLSKWCGAGGWRLGTFAAPRPLAWLIDAMTAVASETYTSTSAPIQHAAVEAFRGGLAIARYLAASRRVLAALAGHCHARLVAAGCQVVRPTGAFYLFPYFTAHAEALARRGITTSRQLADRLLDETGVATLAAADFGRPDHELGLRLSLVDFDGARALVAADLLPSPCPPAALAQLVKDRCGPVVEAIDRLVDWLG